MTKTIQDFLPSPQAIRRRLSQNAIERRFLQSLLRLTNRTLGDVSHCQQLQTTGKEVTHV